MMRLLSGRALFQRGPFRRRSRPTLVRAYSATSIRIVEQATSSGERRRWSVRDGGLDRVASPPAEKLGSPVAALLRFMIPADFPDSVAPEYRAYATWAAAGAVASSAAGWDCYLAFPSPFSLVLFPTSHWSQ
jgi:hypothetical protein